MTGRNNQVIAKGVSEELCDNCNSHWLDQAKNSKEKMLHRAVRNNHEKCMEVLLKAGADVNWANNASYTPLMRAAEAGYVNGVQMLLLAGADVNIECRGNTALHLASRHGLYEVVDLLIQAQSDVNKVRKNSITPLMEASGCNTTFDQGAKCLEMLIKAGADVNKTPSGSSTALVRASFRGFYKGVELLIQAGADVNKLCHAGEEDKTPLLAATSHGHLNVMEILIQAGADVNLSNSAGSTALMAVSYCKQITPISTWVLLNRSFIIPSNICTSKIKIGNKVEKAEAYPTCNLSLCLPKLK